MEPVLDLTGRFKVIEMWENNVKRLIHIPLDSTSCQSMPFPTSTTTTSNNNNTIISTSHPSPQQNNAVSNSLTNELDKNQRNRPPSFIDFRQLKQILEPTQTTQQTSNVTSPPPLQSSPAITLIPQRFQALNFLPQITLPQAPQLNIHQQRATVDNPNNNNNKVIIQGHLRVPLSNGNSIRNTLQIIPSIINQSQRSMQGNITNVPNFGVQRNFQNVMFRPRFPITQQRPKVPLSIQINNKNYYDLKLLKPPHIVLNRPNNGTIIIDDEQTSTQNPSSGNNAGKNKKSKRKDKSAPSRFTNHKSAPSTEQTNNPIEKLVNVADDAISIQVAQGLPSNVTTSSAPTKEIPPCEAYVRLHPPYNQETNPYLVIPSFKGRLKVIIRKMSKQNEATEQIANSEVILNPSGSLPDEEMNKDQLPCPNDRSSDSDKQKCSESKKKKRKKSSESNEGSKRQKMMDGSTSEGKKDDTTPQNAINILGDILDFGETESDPIQINNADAEVNNTANVEVNNTANVEVNDNANVEVNNAETSRVDKIIEDRIDNDITKQLKNDFEKERINAERVNIAAVEPRQDLIVDPIDTEIVNDASETVAQADQTKTSVMKESQNSGKLKTADANSKSQAAKPANTKVFDSESDFESDFETIFKRKTPSNNPKKRPFSEGKHKSSKSSEPPTKQSKSTSSSTKLHHQSKKTSQNNSALETRTRLQSLPDDKSLVFDPKLLTDCKVDLRILKLKSESINLRNITAKDLYCCLRKRKGGYKKRSKLTSSSGRSKPVKNVEAKKRKIN